MIAAGAGEQLVRLAERLEAPVLTNLEGRGAIADDHPLCLGNFFEARSIHKAMRDADVTLAIGTSFAAGVGGAAAALTPPASRPGRESRIGCGLQRRVQQFQFAGVSSPTESARLEAILRLPISDQFRASKSDDLSPVHQAY